jgi:hypothetical protein
VQSSATYRALPAPRRAAADRLAAALCSGLAALDAHLTPAQRRVLVRAYQGGVAALVGPGG